MDQVFAASSKLSGSVDGMLSPFSMAAMDSLLAFQGEQGIKGDMVELGVFRGRSAVIMASRTSPEETLHLYDRADYFDRDALARTGTTLSFNIRDTFSLSAHSFRECGVRFCHIDTGHSFDATLHEIGLADHMLASNGILCLDDFTNLDYSQVLAATYKYLFTAETDLKIFMVTSEKAYLCRQPAFQLYAGAVLDSMIARMAERGISQVCIARTDDTPSYGAFNLRPKRQGETDDFYGADLYRHFYQIRDHSAPSVIARRAARKIIRKASAFRYFWR